MIGRIHRFDWLRGIILTLVVALTIGVAIVVALTHPTDSPRVTGSWLW